MPKPLICSAISFGYGPACKLALIAARLRARGIATFFLGTGLALECARRNPQAFDDILPAPADHPSAREAVSAAGGMLSLMDRDYLTLAHEMQKPAFVVDDLLWMRDSVPVAFRTARRFWAHAFDPDGLTTPAGLDVRVVGPIVEPMPAATVSRSGRVVVNLGGVESPHAPLEESLVWVDFVVRGIVDARSGREVLVLGSERCVEYLKRTYADGAIRFMSAGHQQTVSLFAGAEWVLTAPGLTTSMECFQLQVPTYFLPPQTYSQWMTLQAFQNWGLADGSFHWQELCPGPPLQRGMPEAARNPIVRNAMLTLTHDARAKERYRSCLARYFKQDGAATARRQRAYFNALGSNGLVQIVNELCELIAAWDQKVHDTLCENL